MSQTTTGQAPTSAQLSQMNAQNRALVLHNGLPMLQKIYSSTFVPSAGNVLNIPLAARRAETRVILRFSWRSS